MDGAIQRQQAAGIFSLNIDDLDIGELESRLEMAVASTVMGICNAHCACNGNSCSPCPALTFCASYCE
ncbi:MAG TPA: hypothetical protein VF647_15065 [Longimicrobium sp.]|jgi:hypothetical protein